MRIVFGKLGKRTRSSLRIHKTTGPKTFVRNPNFERGLGLRTQVCKPLARTLEAVCLIIRILQPAASLLMHVSGATSKGGSPNRTVISGGRRFYGICVMLLAVVER